MHRVTSGSEFSQFPGELKDLPRTRLVLRDANDAVVDSLEVMQGELVFDLLNDLRRRIVVPFHVRLVRIELLAGIKLDDLATGPGGLFNRLEDTEPVEGVSLAAEGKAADLVFVRNFFSGNGPSREQGCQPNAKVQTKRFRSHRFFTRFQLNEGDCIAKALRCQNQKKG